MTNEYELADNNRADLIYEKSDLLAPFVFTLSVVAIVMRSKYHQRRMRGR